MSDNLTGWQRISQIFEKSAYFSGFDEFSYLLGIIALALAIAQFGLPYTIPYIHKYFRFVINKASPNEVSVMINKALGYFAFFALISLPLLMLVFIFKMLATIALFIGLAFNSGVALIISALILGVILFFYIRAIKRGITDKAIDLPKSETDKLSRDVNNLGSQISNLANKIENQTDSINRLLKRYEGNDYKLKARPKNKRH